MSKTAKTPSFREMLPQVVSQEAALALDFAAGNQNLALHAVDKNYIADVIASRVIHSATTSGAVIDKEKHQVEVERLTRRARQFEGWWAGIKHEADQQMQRAQVALSELPDRELAARLADRIGVLLPNEEGHADG